MFLNIGEKQSIFFNDIIAVIDIEKLKGKINDEFIENMMKNNNCVSLGKVKRSAIITEKKGKSKVYLSSVSVSSLKKRLSGISNFVK